MAAFSTFFSFFISFFLLSSLTLHSAHVEPLPNPNCPSSFCGDIEIRFPFSNTSNPECGLHTIECKDGVEPTIRFEKSYIVQSISYWDNKLIILDSRLKDVRYWNSHAQQQLDVCDFLYNFTTPTSVLLPLRLENHIYTFHKCNRSKHQKPSNHQIEGLFDYGGCNASDLYYHEGESLRDLLHNCEVIHFPLFLRFDWKVPNLLEFLSKGVALVWTLNQECEDCGHCTQNRTTRNFFCSYPINKKDYSHRQINIGIGAGFGGFVLACLFFVIFWKCCNRRLHPSSSIHLPGVFSSFPYSKPELGKGSTLFRTQIFTYKELKEATDNFNPLRKLGGGGFGTVYHGKLCDGRFVAVKRLYENNYKRVKQFRNEIEILSRLRHQNLVTLYGCGSCYSHDLLLVYEFIPNGTVADHLHSSRAKPNILRWPIRMSIAIETADALTYLHKVEIIHRDVKTNNILLDNDFHVKVADFGLSRLFSFDASHVSTAPQGTPGYVDPDYHRYYQLTDKSDVYSFGVVLIELISSMPAVDVTRHRHEINLAYMAINKISNDELHELVDPALGFNSNFTVRRMITMVAELAFRCLQDQREVRPSMEEVLEVLRGIGNEVDKVEKIEEVSTLADNATSSKQDPVVLPHTMTDAWISRTGTPDINALYIHSLD